MKRAIVLALIVSSVLVISNNAYAVPDLVVSDIRISPNAMGTEHNIFVTTANLGDGLPANYNIRVDYTNGTSGSTGDVGPFSGTGEFNLGSFVLSTSALPGLVTLVATADSSNVIAESNEGNNNRTEQFALFPDPSPWKSAAGPNLGAMPDITLSGPVLDAVPIQVSVMVSNFGNLGISNNIDVLLTSDQGAILDTDANAINDTKIISNSAGDPIAPGAFKTVIFTWTPNVTQNVSELRMIVDPIGVMDESNELNNLTTRPVFEPISISFEASSSTVGEGDAPHAVALLLVAPAGVPLAAPITATVIDQLSGSATADSDYFFASQTVTFAAGSANGDTQNVIVTLIDDVLVEGDELLNLAINAVAGPGVSLGTPSTHSVTLIDNDGGVPELTCIGFMPPFHHSLSLKKKVKRAIPVDMVLTDADGFTVTDADIVAPPVINVLFNAQVFGEEPPNSDDLLPLGSANVDNIFRFDPESGVWIYNLGTRLFKAAGTYTVIVASGDISEYTINTPNDACMQTFERLP